MIAAVTRSRLEEIRKMLADPAAQTAPDNHARHWRADCEYLVAKVDELLDDLKLCVPHVQSYARHCEACEGSGEILDHDEGARRCEHCLPLWDLLERINPKPPAPPEPVQEEVIDDDIPF